MHSIISRSDAAGIWHDICKICPKQPSVKRTASQMKAALALITISTAHVFLLGSAPVLALDPSLDVSQYGHTAWTARDGFSVGAIFAMAQTPDGYLWLGTEFGLFRFDGLQRCPLATTGGAATSQRALRSARDARRHALDWHFCRPCELERQQADRVPGGWPSLCDIAA